MAPNKSTNSRLDKFRGYLRVLARSQLDNRLASRVDPSDIVQETLIEANRSLHAFQGESEAQLAGWLRKILARRLAHAFRDHTRQRRDVRREVSLEASVNASSARLEAFIQDDATSPSQVAAAAERSRKLADAIESLNEDQREGIMQHYFHGRLVREIAEAMQKSEAAIGGLLHRGLQALKTSLREED